MQSLIDFLTFRSLVSPSVLVVMYYLGALGMPIFIIYLVYRLRRIDPSLMPRARVWLETLGLDRGRRWRLLGVMIILFLLGELGWRMMFEFILVYFQIRDALMV